MFACKKQILDAFLLIASCGIEQHDGIRSGGIDQFLYGVLGSLLEGGECYAVRFFTVLKFLKVR